MSKIVLLFLVLLQNYNLISGLVTDYKIMTWNSNGYKLEQVFNLFTCNIHLDMVFLQESGNVASHRPESKYGVPKFYLATAQKQDLFVQDDNLEVRSIRYKNMLLFVYYFPASVGVDKKLSQTIVSRHYTPEVLYFVPQHSNENPLSDRSIINRPIVGLVFNNDIFLNIHAEPTQDRNEVLIQLDIIRRYMYTVRPNASWLLVGDFNRPTKSITVTALENTVSSALNTHNNTVLDYLIYGASNQNVFNSLITTGYRAMVFDGLTGSDHKSVYFTKSNFFLNLCL